MQKFILRCDGRIGSNSTAMKAIRLYGSSGSERVVLEEMPMPKLGAGE